MSKQIRALGVDSAVICFFHSGCVHLVAHRQKWPGQPHATEYAARYLPLPKTHEDTIVVRCDPEPGISDKLSYREALYVMASLQTLTQFARKPLHEKWAATKATIGELWKELSVALMHVRAAHIEFNSGLGNAGHVLYGLVRSMRPDVCVEIGSARGKSACYIGMALKENRRGRLYAIDPHCPTPWNDDIDTAESFRANVSKLGLSQQVLMIRSTSEDAAREWQRPIDLIFIDGDHSYTGAKRDWELFAPHVKPFGIVVFHDTIWDLPPWRERTRADMGVPRLVDELRQQGFQVLTIDQDCGVSIVQPVVGGCPLRNTPTSDTVEHSQPAGSLR